MAGKENEFSQEGYKRAVLQAFRNGISPEELFSRVEATWKAAYSENNPSARSPKTMLAWTEMVVTMLIGKPGVMEMPAEGNAINALIQQVIAAKLAEPHLIIDGQAEEAEP